MIAAALVVLSTLFCPVVCFDFYPDGTIVYFGGPLAIVCIPTIIYQLFMVIHSI